jgi:antitoxin Phd
MPRRSPRPIYAPRPQLGDWKLEDAKARFSEVVRRAHLEGPQAVTVRGRRAVVVIDADEYERLAIPAPTVPLVAFLESLDMPDLDLARAGDVGRDVEL